MTPINKSALKIHIFASFSQLLISIEILNEEYWFGMIPIEWKERTKFQFESAICIYNWGSEKMFIKQSKTEKETIECVPIYFRVAICFGLISSVHWNQKIYENHWILFESLLHICIFIIFIGTQE